MLVVETDRVRNSRRHTPHVHIWIIACPESLLTQLPVQDLTQMGILAVKSICFGTSSGRHPGHHGQPRCER